MEALALFLSSLRSEETKRSYAIYLKKYMEFLGINDFLSETNHRLIEQLDDRIHNKNERNG